MPLLASLAFLVLNFILFIGAVLVFIYLPGFWLLKKVKRDFKPLEIFSLSLSLGTVFFVLVAWGLAFLDLRWLFLPFFVGINLAVVLKRGLFPWMVCLPISWQVKKRRLFYILLALGTLSQLWINVFSGWQYSDGVRFWSAHGHDGPWHGMLIKQWAKGFPLKMTFLSGQNLKNYHFFVDILMGEFHRIFHFSPFDLYFRFFAFFFAALLLVNIFVLARRWAGEQAGLWAMFLGAFGGSFGYIVDLVEGRSFLGSGSEARFWVSQVNTAIGNPPQIAAFCLFLAFASLLYFYFEKKNKFLFWYLALLGAMLVGFKIYGSATALGGLALLASWQLVFKKKRDLWPLFLTTSALAATVFFLATEKGSSFLVWQPWWFVRTMVVAADRLNWSDLELRRQFYLDLGGWRSWIRIFQFEFLALLIFIVGNLGTKVWGFKKLFASVLSRKKPRQFDLFLAFALLTCFVVPHFFVQKGIAWNTVQFFHYFVLLMTIFAGAALSEIFKKPAKLGKKALLGLFVLLSVPTVLANLVFFAPGNALAIVEEGEREALEFMRTKIPSQEVIVTHPFDREAVYSFPGQPRPIYAWDSTGYVAYFTDHEVYYSDLAQVEILNYQVGRQRLQELAERVFFVSQLRVRREKDPLQARQYLLDHKLKYLYLVYNQELPFPPEKAGLEIIFENEAARVYRLGELPAKEGN